jgi:hypothetical protein
MLGKWMGVAAVALIGAWMLIGALGHRARRQVVDTRTPGIDGFAASLGRPVEDPFVHAVFMALLSELGEDGEVVNADDDLGELWGIVDDDLDDLVVESIDRLPPGWSLDLTGRFIELRTPRDMVVFLDANAKRPRRE